MENMPAYQNTPQILVGEEREAFIAEWGRVKGKGLNAGQLKVIACILMLISHIGQTGALYGIGIGMGEVIPFWNQRPGLIIGTLCMIIGRIAFPLFCFFLVQGVMLTKNYYKYLGRLLLFALISEVPFDLATGGMYWDMGAQNVIFTLLLGAIAIIGIEEIFPRAGNRALQIFLSIGWVLFMCLIAFFLRSDYSFMGILSILCLYLGIRSRKKTIIAGFPAFFYEAPLYGTVYLSLPLIASYNGKRGNVNKYFFYLFYPLHFLVLYGIKMLLLY